MKLMDKIKNLFLDEEEYDEEDEEFPQVEVKNKDNKEKKEKKELLKPSKEELPKVMLETIKKEENTKNEKVELKFKPEDVINDESGCTFQLGKAQTSPIITGTPPCEITY